ncbi:putative sulfate exporter family transporter [Amycolatopsis sp. WAC 01376]|uniref:YeiH family protein n=1 Tax=Amycolatopsis sp. WAC 01376 TaxID=2203195 RepID=UPI000F7B79DD|nr:putative sulfate exporter family transporter [Amycolatopsis sp. WAC 01376]RSM61470.1 putative sulfate exporter family transporter [Amycolatopsis sp. WAC 01376]
MSTTHARPTKPFLTAVAVTGAGVGVAYLVGTAFPVVSALTIAVVLGILTGSLPSLSDETRKAISGTTKKLLRAGVVLLGLQLSLPSVLALGPGTLLAVVLTVGITFLGTIGLGRLLGVPRGLAMLVATGFSICGASAIAAMEGVVEREDSDVATAVALVTFYGGLAIAAVPLIGGWLRLDAVRIGEWAGLSVHEVAQVVAAATPAGSAAIAVAIVIKLSRVVLLAPMVAAVGMHERHRPVDGKRPPLVPLFVLGFLAMAAVRSTGVVPGFALDVAKIACTLLLAGALFGLGCAVRIGKLVRTGGRALLLGLLSTLLVGTTALVTLTVLG